MTFEVPGPVLTPFPDPAPARSLLAVAGCCPGVHGVNAESLSGTATGRKRPILLKKSAQVSTVEKYALEIEIFTLSRGFRAQISRSGAQITHLQRSVCGKSGRTDFFNRIGQKQTFKQQNLCILLTSIPLGECSEACCHVTGLSPSRSPWQLFRTTQG
jgi:hypothetical protein